MPDEVWPLAAGSHPPLRSYNGVGTELKGFTGVDATGHRFATCWSILFGIPLIPVGRYYLREVSTTISGNAVHSRTTTRYEMAGESRLRAAEVLRTYAFWLLGLALVGAPLALLGVYADRLGGAVCCLVVVLVGWVIGSIALLSHLLTRYRDEWAPVREVRWLDRRPD